MLGDFLQDVVAFLLELGDSLVRRLGHDVGLAELAEDLAAELLTSTTFYLRFYDWAPDEFQICGQYILLLCDELEKGGEKQLADSINESFNQILDSLS